jgi:hypothetical protein
MATEAHGITRKYFQDSHVGCAARTEHIGIHRKDTKEAITHPGTSSNRFLTFHFIRLTLLILFFRIFPCASVAILLFTSYVLRLTSYVLLLTSHASLLLTPSSSTQPSRSTGSRKSNHDRYAVMTSAACSARIPVNTTCPSWDT